MSDSPQAILPSLFKDQPAHRNIIDQSCATHATGHSVHWIHTRQLEREKPISAHIARIDGRYISLEHAEGYETLWNHNEEWLRALADVVEEEKKEAKLQYWPRFHTLRLQLRDRSVTLNLSERAGFTCAGAATNKGSNTAPTRATKGYPCTLDNLTDAEFWDSQRALEERSERRAWSWEQAGPNALITPFRNP